jgi:hypothetical protein
MPLLFETGSYKLMSLNLLVACNPEVQVRFLTLKDYNSKYCTFTSSSSMSVHCSSLSTYS